MALREKRLLLISGSVAGRDRGDSQECADVVAERCMKDEG